MPRRRRAPTVPEAVAVAREAALRFADEHDFATFQVGCRAPRGLEGEAADTFRVAVREQLRAELAAAWPERRLVAGHAELLVEVVPGQPAPALRVAPLRVAGRYCKLARGISQTVFHCRVCRGRRRDRADCEACGGTGLLVPESVERFVVEPLRRAAGSRRAGFHGSGREDVDVLMLGEGRPFVVTLERPRRRTLDLAAVEQEVAEASDGRVTVSGLRLVDRATQQRITSDHGAKRYRVRIESDADALPADAAERLASLAGVELAQRTPTRVAERRADRVRRRRVTDVEVLEVGERHAVVEVGTDPGTYVKELVSGDDGRTIPSVASLLGVACTCARLDVLSVACDVA